MTKINKADLPQEVRFVLEDLKFLLAITKEMILLDKFWDLMDG